ncbi:GSCOCT00013074001.2-RA-CDS [Cotesia congregata]|uniref:Cc_single_13.6 n=1 Tax=Cotesia congregata TaxID=51543 RepID=S6D4R1_COTCN|nr:GSCOCT00013074001.2-RA-CDS [Cotesia congregata]CAG5092402.1 cc_single_13.6 [Cotesia congregata]CCQ71164.1 hypothetical protein CcBV_13.6 [Cotesia congregata]
MIVNKTVITLCIAILGVAWIEATDENSRREVDGSEYPLTPRPGQLLILESPLLYLDPVSHSTPGKSTTPLPSSTTEDDLSYQLSKSLHSTGNRPSEETEFIGATTTEGGIVKEELSLATQTEDETILEELMSLIRYDEEITSEKLKPSIESLLNAHIIIGSISFVLLLIILFLVIRENYCVRKTAELDYSQFGKHPNMVYQTTIEVDSLLGKSVE